MFGWVFPFCFVLFFRVCTKKKGTLWPKSDITEEGSNELEAFRPR